MAASRRAHGFGCWDGCSAVLHSFIFAVVRDWGDFRTTHSDCQWSRLHGRIRGRTRFQPPGKCRQYSFPRPVGHSERPGCKQGRFHTVSSLMTDPDAGHGGMASTVTIALTDRRRLERRAESGMLEGGELADKFQRLTRGMLGERGAMALYER